MTTDRTEPKERRKKKEVVLLADLAPRKDVKGGAGRRFFGERLDTSEGVDVDESH